MFAFDNSFFIIKSKHQSIFGVNIDWTSDFLFNYQRLYLLIIIIFFNLSQWIISKPWH